MMVTEVIACYGVFTPRTPKSTCPGTEQLFDWDGNEEQQAAHFEFGTQELTNRPGRKLPFS